MNRQRLMAVLTASLCCLTTSPATLAKPAGTLSVIPDEAKRPAVRSILRDVPSGTRLASGANQVLEVVFVDGSSLILGPNTEAVVAAYEYDPQSRMGRLEVRVSRGQLRVAGGALNNTAPIILHTPAARLELDNGSAFVAVEQNGRTRTHLLLGRRLTMSSGGKTKTLLRSGFELVSVDADTPPEGPKRMEEEELLADAGALNPWLRGGPVVFEGEEVAEEGGEGEDEASQVALLEEGQRRSDLVDQSQDFEAFSGITGGRPGALADALDPAAGFGGNPLGAPDISGDLPTQADGDLRSLAQNRTNAQVVNGVFEESPRDGGPTTNRLFNSTKPFTQVLGDEEPQAVADTADGISATPIPPDEDLQYVFSNNAGLSLVVDRVGALPDGDHVLLGGGTYDVTAPFLLTGIELPNRGEIFKDDVETITTDEFSGQGSIFKPATHYEFLQAGFSLVSRKDINDFDQDVVEREADNFLLLEVRPGEIVNGQPVLDEDRAERFLFAAGDIDGVQTPLTEREVHRFFISPGLDGFDERNTGATVAAETRAFLRSETAQGLGLHDSGVLVAYPRSGASADAQNALLHADFGLEGTGAQQRSTISVTIGELVEDEDDPGGIRRARVSGSTLASSRDNRDRDPVTGASEASLLAVSPLFSSASGGGNPVLDRAGRAGYIVLENFDPDDPDTGGVERPLDLAGDEERYAILRLATATDAHTLATGASETFQGYAAGLAEFQGPGGIGLTQIDSGEIPGNVVIETSPETNRLRATLNLTTDGTSFTPFTLGGLSGLESLGASAFIDDDRFAALSVGANELALVSGELVKDGLPEDMQQPIRDYQHVKWGFFFGDMITEQDRREHVHLGTWAVGKLPEPGDLPTIGTATYTGHAIGNVFNNGSLYTAVGSYRNSWDFAARRGSVSMGFDGTPYGSETRLIDNSVQFRGRLNPLDGAQRTGALHGSFVGPPIGSGPAGQVGRFSINETAGPAYRASGTFAAEQ